MTHVILLGCFAFIILMIAAIAGVFGVMIAKTLAWMLIVGVVLCIYFSIHHFFFGESDNSWG